MVILLGGGGTEDVVSHWGAADKTDHHPQLGEQTDCVEWTTWSRNAKEHAKGTHSYTDSCTETDLIIQNVNFKPSHLYIPANLYSWNRNFLGSLFFLRKLWNRRGSMYRRRWKGLEGSSKRSIKLSFQPKGQSLTVKWIRRGQALKKHFTRRRRN